MAHYVRIANKSTSGSTSAVSSATSGRGSAQVAKQVAGKLQGADIDRLNRLVPGNSEESASVIKFPVADVDIFVSHRLGFRVDNFEVTNPDRPARFYAGSKTPTRYGLWVRSDTPGVTARVRVYGQRIGQRRG